MLQSVSLERKINNAEKEDTCFALDVSGYFLPGLSLAIMIFRLNHLCLCCICAGKHLCSISFLFSAYAFFVVVLPVVCGRTLSSSSLLALAIAATKTLFGICFLHWQNFTFFYLCCFLSCFLVFVLFLFFVLLLLRLLLIS